MCHYLYPHCNQYLLWLNLEFVQTLKVHVEANVAFLLIEVVGTDYAVLYCILYCRK